MLAFPSSMSPSELKDWIFGVSAASLLCVYPLVILIWILLDSRWASNQGGVSPGGNRARRRAGRRGCEKVADEDECKKPSLSTTPWDVLKKALAQLLPAWRMVSGGLFFFVCTVRLILYAALLVPWFLQIAWAYVTHPLLRRSIRYGPNSRNYLDVYLPEEALLNIQGKSDKKVPVVVVVMGGAWIIGHRAWNTHVGLRLSDAGILVVAVDYRNFPFATLPEMLSDVEHALDWVFANVAEYGGDKKNMVLLGQSAGAHLEALLLVERAMAEAKLADSQSQDAARAATGGTKELPAGAVGRDKEGAGNLLSARRAWSVRDFKAWVGVSGVYDLVALDAHLKAMGVASWLPKMCEGQTLNRFSPTRLLLEAPEWRPTSSPLAAAALARLPPVSLFHGEDDTSVPLSSINGLASALRARGLRAVSTDIRPGIAHATPVVEDPFRGGDIQTKLVVPFLGPEAEQRLAALPPPWPRPPRAVVNVAEYLMPF